MCNLHIHTIIKRNNELLVQGIREITVFQSSKKAMLKRHATAPFALIADSGKSLNRELGVEALRSSVLRPDSWNPLIKGIFRHSVIPLGFHITQAV